MQLRVKPFRSPLIKGDSGGYVFSGLSPFSRGQVYNPLAPFSFDWALTTKSKGASLCDTSYNQHKQNENSYTMNIAKMVNHGIKNKFIWQDNFTTNLQYKIKKLTYERFNSGWHHGTVKVSTNMLKLFKIQKNVNIHPIVFYTMDYEP